MAYEAVPVDVEIQKLTSAERDALARYKIHENINTFLGNERTPTLIAGGILLVSAPTILKLIFDALAKQKPEFDLDIKEAGIDYLTFTKDFAEAIFDVSGAGKGLGFFEGEAEDFWSKYVKK
jgi:hypothetical protein